ncbi:hypothetical protein ACIQH5_19560 [Paenarthrobacter sp. NPDC091711]|uniref:maleate cis-trans isomerase family protein n=1 Tax=Paenarthrobacter sp. NPDC091711 TaxID=3364385 RepID=UPI003809BA50
MVPSTNATVEADFHRLLPDGISTHSERLYIPDGQMSPDFLDIMNAELPAKVQLLASARVDAIVYACTSGSFYRGASWDREVKELVESTAQLPCVTTSVAVAEALRHLGARNLSVSTPYPDWTNDRLSEYYGAAGFNVLTVDGDRRAAATGHGAVNDQDPQEITEFAVSKVAPGTDTLFLSCTAWRAVECVTELESITGFQTVTSNQASLWAVLKALGLEGRVTGVGALFNPLPARTL